MANSTGYLLVDMMSMTQHITNLFLEHHADVNACGGHYRSNMGNFAFTELLSRTVNVSMSREVRIT
jgi:hypothetical protein